MKRITFCAFLFTALAAGAPATADDASAADTLLCSIMYANECRTDGCEGALPLGTNIPQFIEIDLKNKVLSTTRASGENRSTPFKNLQRDAGLIIVQGYEMGRAFSMVITEESGFATMGVTVDDGGVVAFGSCTPR